MSTGNTLCFRWTLIFTDKGIIIESDKLEFDKGGDCMKLKHKIVVEILLVITAIAVFIYNFSMQREIAYIASIVAVCGTIALLIKNIVKWKKNK